MILRELTPEIVCCNQILLNPSTSSNTSNNNYKFISYLTGLIEGDGTIIVPFTDRSYKGKLNYPSIQIVFHLKDLPLALLIQKKFRIWCQVVWEIPNVPKTIKLRGHSKPYDTKP
jgi:hypothetical protein